MHEFMLMHHEFPQAFYTISIICLVNPYTVYHPSRIRIAYCFDRQIPSNLLSDKYAPHLHSHTEIYIHFYIDYI